MVLSNFFLKKIKQMILEKTTKDGSNWASPMVAIRKPDWDLRICGDYKIGVNHQICSDTFPWPNTETAKDWLARMKYLAKIELKSANKNHQNWWEIQVNLHNKYRHRPIKIDTSAVQHKGYKPHFFKKQLKKNLSGIIKNTLIYQDDICVEELTNEFFKHKI